MKYIRKLVYNMGQFKSLLVLGAQWGDEGKGKITNYFSERADVVVRYQGGNNAGHTIVFDGKKFALRLIPSGVFNENVKCVMAHGMVINPIAFLEEVEGLKQNGVNCHNIYVSDRAQVIFIHHLLLDELNEQSLGDKKIGTTKKGIGPCYTDKVARIGMRMVDFISDDFPMLYKTLLEVKNKQIVSLGGSPISYDETLPIYEKVRQEMMPYVVDTIKLLSDEKEKGSKILFEGAQGALLDIDFGTYPYVTSSNVTVGGTISGSGVGLNGVQKILGIVKAYQTRVGEGAMPTELFDEFGDYIRERGHEYGTVTKRPRRCGYLDLVALKYSVRINGITNICLTLADVLSDIKTLKVCTHYEIDGKLIDTIPASNKVFSRCTAIYTELKPWHGDISNIKEYEFLPIELKEYIAFIEKEVGVKVSMVSVGPDRNQTIIREQLF